LVPLVTKVFLLSTLPSMMAKQALSWAVQVYSLRQEKTPTTGAQ